MQKNQQQSNSQQFKLYKDQVSGKTPKFTDQSGENIFKMISHKQLLFYQYMDQVGNYSGDYSIKKYIPEFKGTYTIDHSCIEEQQSVEEKCKRDQWINHIAARTQSNHAKKKGIQNQEIYIKMKNITQGYQYPCIMDIKLGSKKQSKKKKFNESTTNSHHFRINGMCTKFKQAQKEKEQEHFISKYYFQKVSDKLIQAHLSFFFYEGYAIDQQLLQRCIQQTKDIIQAMLHFRGGEFNSSSLLICYDADDHSKYAVKIIDFDQYCGGNKDCPDYNVIEGLKNTLQYLTSIVKNIQTHEQTLINRQLDLFSHQQVIPDRIVEKYKKQTQKD